jgi:hypothetical protein
MVVSSVGLLLKCDCSGKAQKQFNSKLQTRFLVREDALKAERCNCQTKEEQDKIWSRVPRGGPIPRLTGRLTVGRKTNSNSNSRVPASRKSRQKGNTVSDETVKYGYWVLMTWLVSDCTVNYRPVFSSDRAPWKKNNVIISDLTSQRLHCKLLTRPLVREGGP